MLSRRAFLRTTGLAGTAALAIKTRGLDDIVSASASVAGQAPADVARDEFYWREIQQSFALDRTLINLNTGHHCSQPRIVLDAVKRYLDIENQAPGYYGGQLNRNLEPVRRGLANEFGCDVEEMAITRNASESLQIVQNGIDLSAGDEVVTTEQDYPRMLTTWDQRMRRDKIVVTRVQFPVPTTADDLYARIERAITPRTKVLHFCHITNLSGQLFPVQRLCRMARARGIRTIVDGAHAAAQFPFVAPGSRMRRLRRQPAQVAARAAGQRHALRAPGPDREVLAAAGRAGQEHHQHPQVRGDRHGAAAVKAAIADALAFHQAIGAERKAARLYYLTMRWANALRTLPRIRMHSSLKPGETWGLAAVGIDGMERRRR